MIGRYCDTHAMSALRNYPDGVRMALVALSRGTCYWPRCPEPVFKVVEAQPVFNLQFAHIYAAKPGGPRYSPDMEEGARKSFKNLVLFCHPHHTLVDKRDPEKYPVRLLLEWKRQRESDDMKGLALIGPIADESLLEQLLGELQESIYSRFDQVINQVYMMDKHLGLEIRAVYDELRELKSSGLDRATIAAMEELSSRLVGLQDAADQIGVAASRLEDHAPLLSAAVDEIGKLGRYM